MDFAESWQFGLASLGKDKWGATTPEQLRKGWQVREQQAEADDENYDRNSHGDRYQYLNKHHRTCWWSLQSWAMLTPLKYLASSYLLGSFRGWRLHTRSCRPWLRGGRRHKGPWQSSPKLTRRSLPAGPRNRSWILRVINWLTTSSRTLVTCISKYVCT